MSRDQLTLCFTSEMIPQPGGAYLVRPGKPVQWALCSEAARRTGIAARTLRDWIDNGTVPEALADGTVVYRKRSPKLWEFNLAALDLLKQRWTEQAVLR